MGRVLHVARGALHVHGDGARAAGPYDFAHHGVAQAGDVVDDLRPDSERGLGDGGFHGVDGKAEVCEALDHGQDAAQFLCFADGLRAGTRGFAADVDDVRAFRGEAMRVGDRAFHIGELAAVGKRIRGHIQHAHDEGAVRKIKDAGFRLPNHL